jgi:hypothetical protein
MGYEIGEGSGRHSVKPTMAGAKSRGNKNEGEEKRTQQGAMKLPEKGVRALQQYAC